MSVARMVLFLAIGLAGLPGWLHAESEGSRFRAIPIVIDPGGAPLAAWQAELTHAEGVRLVGIEGGASPAFAEPGFHDPVAAERDVPRMIVAGYSAAAASDLPTGPTRVGTLMVRLAAADADTPILVLQAAADPAGEPVDAELVAVDAATAGDARSPDFQRDLPTDAGAPHD